MTSSNAVDNSTKKHCKFDVECPKSAHNHCEGCGQRYCKDHYLEHQKNVEEDLKNAMHTHESVNEKWKSLISEFSSDDVLDLIKPIYEFSVKSDEIEKSATMIQRHLQENIDEDQPDSNRLSITITNEFELNQSNSLENDIQRLNDDIAQLELKLQEVSNDHQHQRSGEQSPRLSGNASSDGQSSPIKAPRSHNEQRKKKHPVEAVFSTIKNTIANKMESTPTLSHLLVRQTSPAILDLKEHSMSLPQLPNQTHSGQEEEQEEEEEDDDEEIIVYLDPKTAARISQKVRFSNNIVRYLRGPFKAMVHGTMHAVDICAQGTHINEDALLAVKKGLVRQSQIPAEQQTSNNSIVPAFAEITANWKVEGENPDRGFSSPSIWMRDHQGRRILAKIQEHPLCAANEWLSYVLGRFLGLPVNEVQIAVYENSLVTLHMDVALEDEKTVTYMDLPKERRKAMLTDPIMERMDIFDRIIQNVDRNQQNMLITMPKTTDVNDDTAKMKIHLIDHSNCFGMGKLNGISLIAAKFHSNHLAVVKFDPIHKSRQFEQYLVKLPVADRPLISKTLNRFANITNEQIDSWINEIQDLLSSSQYNRIHGVLYRQRDIVKRYLTQWGISPRASSIKLNGTRQDTNRSDEFITFL